jgi:hypothetical protein
MPDLVDRGKFESRLTDTLTAVFEKYKIRIQTLLASFDTKLGDLRSLPPALYEELQADLIPVIKEVLIEAYVQAFTSFDGFLADNSARTARRGALFIRNDAEQWADFYAPKLAKDMSETTKSQLRAIADRSPLLPISGLGIGNTISRVLDIRRAQLVARTEITNTISRAEQGVIDTFETDIDTEKIWYTKLDERVCPICRPRHGKPQGTNWEIPPPAHPRCRCEVKYRVDYKDGKIIEVRSLEEVELGKSQVLEVRR